MEKSELKFNLADQARSLGLTMHESKSRYGYDFKKDGNLFVTVPNLEQAKQFLEKHELADRFQKITSSINESMLYAARVKQLELQNINTSDAQGIADAEIMSETLLINYLKESEAISAVEMLPLKSMKFR